MSAWVKKMVTFIAQHRHAKEFSTTFLPIPEMSSPTVTPKHFVSTVFLFSLIGALPTACLCLEIEALNILYYDTILLYSMT